MRREDASFFDPHREFSIVERQLPHWEQAGTFAFVTFRLADSLPTELAVRYRRECQQLLRQAGLAYGGGSSGCLAENPVHLNPSTLQEAIRRAGMSARAASLLRWKLFQAWDRQLDELRGACHLARREAAEIVVDGLMKFDGDRYQMAAFVVMPNHVHLMAAFVEPDGMTRQGAGWRKYFAREINRLLGRSGHLWQEDQFDHLVRSESSFERIRRYMIDNPAKARLRSGQYRLYVSPKW